MSMEVLLVLAATSFSPNRPEMDFTAVQMSVKKRSANQ